MKRIYALILSFGAFTIALDQWTKSLALETFAHPGDTREFLGWWNWTLVHNQGAAFGSFRGLPESVRVGFLIALPLAVLTFLWWAYVRKFAKDSTIGPVAMGFVLGGAVGNLIDRIRFGYVIDFIDWFYPSNGECLPLFHKFTPTSCHWPVFNVADSAICLAVALLFIDSWRNGTADSASKT